MITMEILGRIRRMFLRDGLGYSEIARRTGIARNTVKRWLKGAAVSRRVTATARNASLVVVPASRAATSQVQAPKYRRCAAPKKLAPFIAQVEQALVADAGRIKRDRRTGKHLFTEIKANGYTGGCSGLTDFIGEWRTRQGSIANGARQAFIPLLFALGEAFQFDWSIEPLSSGASATGCRSRACCSVPAEPSG